MMVVTALIAALILSSAFALQGSDSSDADTTENYTVTFYGSGGTTEDGMSFRTYTVHGGQSIELPVTTFTRSGYYLSDWNLGSSSGTGYDPGARYVVNSDVSFYANWSNTYPSGYTHISEADCIVEIGDTETFTPYDGDRPESTNDPWWGWQYRDGYQGSYNTHCDVTVVKDAPTWVDYEYHPGSTWQYGTVTFSYTPNVAGVYVVQYDLEVDYSIAGYGNVLNSRVCWVIAVPSSMDYTYTVQFDANGGTAVGNGLNPEAQPAGVSVPLPDEGDVSYANHTLMGWDITVGGQTATFAPGGLYTIDVDDFGSSDTITARAHWLEGSYVLIYNPLNAEGVRGESYSYGDEVVLDSTAGDVESPEGTYFGGWYLNDDDNTILAPGMSYEITGKFILGGYWIPDGASTYTVTFNSNGGSTSNLVVEVEDGKSVYLPQIGFERSGWTFAGWADSSGREVSGTSFEPSADTTLYAQWVENSVPVRSISILGSSTVYEDDTLDLRTSVSPSNASNTDITFRITSGNGIYLSIVSQDSESGTVRVQGLSAGTAIITAYANDGSGVTASKTITILEAENNYTHTLEYNLNGGFTGPDDESRNTGTISYYEFTISTEIPTYPGHRFLGWADTSTGEPVYGWEEGQSTTITVSGTKTIYAIWEEIPESHTHTLNYRTNGGTWDNGSLIDQDIIVDQSEEYVFTIRDDFPTRLGWTPVGWSLDPNASPDDEDALLTAGETITVSDSEDLYVIWVDQRNVFRVTYDANFGDADSVPEPWEDKSSSTLYRYQIDFNTIPTRDGCVFLGWSESPSAVEPEYTADGDSVLEIRMLGDSVNGPSVTLYAIWGVFSGTHILEFNPNGGTFGITQLISPENSGESYLFEIPEEIPVREGFTFLGWSTDPNAMDGTYSYGGEYPTIAVTVKATLYAIWESDGSTNHLEIVYSLNGGSGNFGSETYDGPETSFEFEITDLRPVKGDSRFMGWSTDPAAKTAEYPYGQNNSITVTTDNPSVVLYAVWKDVPNGSFVVTFNPNGGSSVSEQIVVKGGTATEPKNPIREGYTFLGWFTSDGVGFDFSDPIDSDITLYALWTLNEGGESDDDLPLAGLVVIVFGVVVILLGLFSADPRITVIGMLCTVAGALVTYFL